jgi:hypothetical protein
LYSRDIASSLLLTSTCKLKSKPDEKFAAVRALGAVTEEKQGLAHMLVHYAGRQEEMLAEWRTQAH